MNIPVRAIDTEAASLAPDPSAQLYGTRWNEQPAPKPRLNPAAWAILGDPGGALAKALAAELARQRGVEPMPVRDLAEAGPAEPRTYVCVLDGEGAGVDWTWAEGLLAWIQRLASTPGARLWLVTASGVIGPVSGQPHPGQLFAWGLGRALAAEVPQLFAGLVDADGPQAAADLIDIISADPVEDEWLVRRGRFLTPRLERLEPAQAPLFRPHPERLHILTGGLAGLTAVLAQALIDAGARRLLIVGRSPPLGERAETLRGLRSQCERVDYLEGDVALAGTAERIFEAAQAAGCGVGGIYHLASSWRLDGETVVGPLTTLTAQGLSEVLGAKASGALHLQDLALRTDADLLVLFSTAASVLGSPAQLNYAAANAVLDGVAEQMARAGRRAVSIAWGPISDVGFGAQPDGAELHQVWARLGIGRLSPQEMMGLLGPAVATGRPCVMAARLDEPALGGLAWISRRPVYALFSANEVERGAALADLEGLDMEGRRGVIAARLRTNLAQILSLEETALGLESPLIDLGVDSLAALELLFTVERDFAISVPFNESVLDADVTLSAVAIEVERLVAAAS